MPHPLFDTIEALESAVSRADSDVGTGVAAVSHRELEELTTRVWQFLQQVQGSLLLPLVAETTTRELHRHPDYAAASSIRDLVAGWLRCSPAVAGRLVFLARHLVNGAYTSTGQSLARGEIDTEHARAVVRSVRALPSEVLDEADHARAESTMLRTAHVTDAEVTGTAGRRLLEILAPEAAQDHADRNAERERARAESARWMEVTGFGIAGAKEFRLRAESEVIDTLLRVVTPLVQPEPAATVDDAPTRTDPTDRSDRVSRSSAAPPDQSTTSSSRIGRNRLDRTDVDQSSPIDRAEHSTQAGVQTPGDFAEGWSGPRPVERRRADAMVEVIDTLARPDLLDDLTAGQLRWLADQLEPGMSGTSRNHSNTAGPAATATTADQCHDTSEHGGGVLSPSPSRDPADGPDDRRLASELPLGDDGGSVEQGDVRDADSDLVVMVDAGQVTTDSCDASGPFDSDRSIDASWLDRSEHGTAIPEGIDDPASRTATGHPSADRAQERPTAPTETPFTTEPAWRYGSGSTTEDGRINGNVEATAAARKPPRTARSVRTGNDGLRRERSSLVVIANYDHQRGRSTVGEVSSTGAPTRLASATEVERMACEATITPVWMVNNTTPVQVAAPTRFFRGKQLAALIARDRGCSFPGCSRGLRYAHAHHIRKWSEGGPTSVDNGVLLCSHHHRLIHGDNEWEVRLGPDGLPEFVPPRWIDPQRQPVRHTRHRTDLPAAA